MGEIHPAAVYARDMHRVASRARGAAIALGGSALLQVLFVLHAQWQNAILRGAWVGRAARDALRTSDAFVSPFNAASWAILFLTAVAFLRWLHLVVRLTRALGGLTLRWFPSDAVLGFFIPFVSLVRPYHVVRDVYESLAVERVPAPVAHVGVGDAVGYRDAILRLPPAPARLSHASIGIWWALFCAGKMLMYGALRMEHGTSAAFVAWNDARTASMVVSFVAAVMAIRVVRAVTARLMERYRRVRHNTVETLNAAGIDIL